jgi:hypothetical protein
MSQDDLLKAMQTRRSNLKKTASFFGNTQDKAKEAEALSQLKALNREIRHAKIRANIPLDEEDND